MPRSASKSCGVAVVDLAGEDTSTTQIVFERQRRSNRRRTIQQDPVSENETFDPNAADKRVELLGKRSLAAILNEKPKQDESQIALNRF